MYRNNIESFFNETIEKIVDDKIADIKPPKEIIKETIIKENMESTLKCYTVKEVSKFLGIADGDVRRLINSGQLKAIKFRSLKISASELNRFLNEASGKDFTELFDD